MIEFHSGCPLEGKGDQVDTSSCPGVPYRDHAGVLLSIIQEILKALPGSVRPHQEHGWIAHHIDDGVEVLVGEGSGYLMRKNGEGGDRRNQCMAIRSGLRGFGISHSTSSTRSIDNDHGLSK